VAALHSFVGLAAVLIATGIYAGRLRNGPMGMLLLSELAVGSFIGAVTFTGSVVAWGKLKGILSGNPLVFKSQHILNLVLGLAMLGCAVVFILDSSKFPAFILMTGIAFVLGVLLILPIGGADMPVVVSMLNSYSGWAAAATGFTLNNNLLITTGALVGSSGAILSFIMCKAMNRGFFSVILGGFGGEARLSAASGSERKFKSASTEDLTFMLENATKVIIVPGYGMAVAQAQHATKDLYEILSEKGISVKFAIHPVAGRMPGHMNVLLAESEIPYDSVFEMDEINSEFSSCDVALIVGANDVINPDAKTNQASPLYGMPILEAYKAKQVFVNKRSMKAGYAGVDNALFYYPNCSLVFGDAKIVIEQLVKHLKRTGH